MAGAGLVFWSLDQSEAFRMYASRRSLSATDKALNPGKDQISFVGWPSGAEQFVSYRCPGPDQPLGYLGSQPAGHGGAMWLDKIDAPAPGATPVIPSEHRAVCLGEFPECVHPQLCRTQRRPAFSDCGFRDSGQPPAFVSGVVRARCGGGGPATPVSRRSLFNEEVLFTLTLARFPNPSLPACADRLPRWQSS